MINKERLKLLTDEEVVALGNAGGYPELYNWDEDNPERLPDLIQDLPDVILDENLAKALSKLHGWMV